MTLNKLKDKNHLNPIEENYRPRGYSDRIAILQREAGSRLQVN